MEALHVLGRLPSLDEDDLLWLPVRARHLRAEASARVARRLGGRLEDPGDLVALAGHTSVAFPPDSRCGIVQDLKPLQLGRARAPPGEPPNTIRAKPMEAMARR